MRGAILTPAMKSTLPAFAAILALLSPPLDASPLKGATVSCIVNDVEVVDAHGSHRRAAEREILDDDASVRVGAQSRVEFVFADRTLARLGAETALRFQPKAREFALDRGTLLLQIPKFRGGARIVIGSLTITCGGATILVEHLPGKSLKAVVLEGEMRVCVARFLGDSIVVPAGKMLITNPDVKRIPDPVDTDLRKLVTTSALINPIAFCREANQAGVAPLPSLPQIVRGIARQEDALKRKRLIRTNLVIVGSGTNVIIPSAVTAVGLPNEQGNAGNASAVDQNREKESRRNAGMAAPLVAGNRPELEAFPPPP